MPRKKKEESSSKIIEKPMAEPTEAEKYIKLLEAKIESLNKLVIDSVKSIEYLDDIARKANKVIARVDNLFVDDLCKRYGFDSETMYYIGTASSYVYRKPINKEIVALISRIDVLDWRQIQIINKYFMQK